MPCLPKPRRNLNDTKHISFKSGVPGFSQTPIRKNNLNCVPKLSSTQVSKNIKTTRLSHRALNFFPAQVSSNIETTSPSHSALKFSPAQVSANIETTCPSNCAPKFSSAQVRANSETLKNNKNNFSSRQKSNVFIRDYKREKTCTINNVNNKVSLPHVYLKTNFNDKPLCFLIDTGSTISIVKLSSLQNKPVLGPEIIKLKGLSDNDSYCESLGSVTLKFEHRVSSKNKLVFDFVFHAISDTINLYYDGIIGSDFIQYFKLDIQYSTNTLRVEEGYEIPFCFSKQSYIIPPRSEMVIECPVSNLHEINNQK